MEIINHYSMLWGGVIILGLAAACGLAVTGTMALTGIMLTWIFYLKGQWLKWLIAILVTMADAVYFLSNTYKIPHGGYWSIVLAAIPFAIIMIHTRGEKRRYGDMSRGR